MNTKQLEKYSTKEFDIWWENEAEDIATRFGGDEINWNLLKSMCEIAWSNGSYVTQLWYEEEKEL